MLCQRCQSRPATVHVVRAVNQEREEEYLCEVCAAEKGHFHLSATTALPDFFPQLAKMFTVGGGVESRVQLACPQCGMTLRQLSQKSRPGCPQCYEVFQKQLRPLLARIHGYSRHRGLAPEQLQQPRPSEQGEIKTGAVGADHTTTPSTLLSEENRRLEDLRRQMHTMVAEERFEEAAALRDEIRSLEHAAKEADKIEADKKEVDKEVNREVNSEVKPEVNPEGKAGDGNHDHER